jgi:hypothetical protein
MSTGIIKKMSAFYLLTGPIDELHMVENNFVPISCSLFEYIIIYDEYIFSSNLH